MLGRVDFVLGQVTLALGVDFHSDEPVPLFFAVVLGLLLLASTCFRVITVGRATCFRVVECCFGRFCLEIRV